MKKGFVALILLSASLSGVFAGCAGCGGPTGKTNEAGFASNWYADSSYGYVQPTFDTNDDKFVSAEEITYDITFDGSKAANPSYTVEYAAGGTFTTTFYALNFDKTLIAEEYRADYPDNLKVYYYKTVRSIPNVTFKMKNGGGEYTANEEQRLETECYFLDVANHLRPVYSVQDIKNVIPAEYQTGEIDKAYKKLSLRYETSYSFDGNNALTTVTDRLDGNKRTTSATGGLNDTQNSLIDVSQLNIAARALPLKSNLVQAVTMYSPAGKKQDYTLSGSQGIIAEEERKTIETKLAAKNLYVGGEDKKLETVGISVALNAEFKGVSQRYWFTAPDPDHPKNDRGRATLVKMSEPLTFALGLFEYSLNEIKTTVY